MLYENSIVRSLLVGVVAVLLVVGGVASAQTPTASSESFALARANRGDATAQFSLGYAYGSGLGVPQDYVEAHKWYNLAASHPAARISLKNQTRSRESRDAVAKLMTPAQLAEAQKRASAWVEHLETRRDSLGGQLSGEPGSALAALRVRANRGDAAAQFSLGYAYGSGQSVPQDYVEAHKWRILAASRAPEEWKERFTEARDWIAKEMTPAQLAEAQTSARAWLAAFEKRDGK